jgi:hypothetical protein
MKKTKTWNNGVNHDAIVLDPEPKTLNILNYQVVIDIEGQDIPYIKIFTEPEISVRTHCLIPYLPFEALGFRDEIIQLLSK